MRSLKNVEGKGLQGWDRINKELGFNLFVVPKYSSLADEKWWERGL